MNVLNSYDGKSVYYCNDLLMHHGRQSFLIGILASKFRNRFELERKSSGNSLRYGVYIINITHIDNCLQKNNEYHRIAARVRDGTDTVYFNLGLSKFKTL